jgi:hypothetical protein
MMTGPQIFMVPGDGVAWCTALAEALSVCCAAPNDHRLVEVVLLINCPPDEYLPESWVALVAAARAWAPRAQLVAFGMRDAFAGMRLIEAALRDLPAPVPAWATRYA